MWLVGGEFKVIHLEVLIPQIVVRREMDYAGECRCLPVQVCLDPLYQVFRAYRRSGLENRKTLFPTQAHHILLDDVQHLLDRFRIFSSLCILQIIQQDKRRSERPLLQSSYA